MLFLLSPTYQVQVPENAPPNQLVYSVTAQDTDSILGNYLFVIIAKELFYYIELLNVQFLVGSNLKKLTHK
jgi:hypothetical protein